jgi:hypothetical protein
MALKVDRVRVWAATIKDRPGGLAEKLSALADAGANLEFVIARRTAEKKGQGVVFVTPLKGRKQIGAARKAGFKEAESLHSVRVEGPDKPGQGAKITEALAEAGVNLRGLSAAAIGKKFVLHIAVDTSKDATKVLRTVRGMK